jgi:hypothetical protein
MGDQSEPRITEFSDTEYTVYATEAGIVYTVCEPQTGRPLLQMTYDAAQAEQLAEELLLGASAHRLIQDEATS